MIDDYLQRIRTSVYDPREEIMVFNDDITTISQEVKPVQFICFVSNPTGSRILFNLALHEWLPGIRWQGNILVVAREASSALPIDFTDELVTCFKRFLARFVMPRHVRMVPNSFIDRQTANCTFKELVAYVQDDVVFRRCIHGDVVVKDPNEGYIGSRFLSNEVLLIIMGFADFSTLVTLSQVSKQLRNLVPTGAKDLIEDSLAPFVPKSAQTAFFNELRATQGLIFGDLVLQTISGRNWTVVELHVSVPWRERLRMRLWFLRLGFRSDGESERRYNDCDTHILTHEEVRRRLLCKTSA